MKTLFSSMHDATTIQPQKFLEDNKRSVIEAASSIKLELKLVETEPTSTLLNQNQHRKRSQLPVST